MTRAAASAATACLRQEVRPHTNSPPLPLSPPLSSPSLLSVFPLFRSCSFALCGGTPTHEHTLMYRERWEWGGGVMGGVARECGIEVPTHATQLGVIWREI